MSQPAAPTPSESYAYDVFISYSTKDKDWVRGELLRRLERAGLKCCIDYRDFEIGAPAIAELKRAATTSRKTLMVLTPHYLESKWTEFERYLSQTPDPLNKKLRLIPLLKERCELPEDITYLTYLNFIDADDLVFAWNQLLTALGKPPAATISDKEAPKQWLLAHPYGMPSHFTGRIAERQRLSDWLQHGTEPLFVLRALGGFGKSALTWYWLLHDVTPEQRPRVVWWSFYEQQADFNSFLRETVMYLGGRELGDLPSRQQLDHLLDLLQQPSVLVVMDGFERELRAYSSMAAAYQGDEIPPTPLLKDSTEISSSPLFSSVSSAKRGGYRGGQDRDCVNPYAEDFLRKLSSLPNLRSKVLMTTRLRPRPVELTGGALLQGCREEELTQMQSDDAVTFFRSQGIRGNRSEIEAACAAYGYHPLSLRLLSGLVVNDFRQAGDIKAAQRLDVTGDLVQRQHHVLEQSYLDLTDARRRLLSRIACFRSPVDYGVLEAINCASSPPGPPKLGGNNLQSPPQLGDLGGNPAYSTRELEADLRDLIDRGLLQYDRRTKRFDLHPIVRRYAYDRMGTPERTRAHEQLRDYFAAVPAVETVQALAELTPVIELYHHMVQAGQYDEAQQLFEDRLATPLYFQLGAYQLQIELLRALFPQGEDQPPQLQDESAQAWTLNELANSYSLNGQPVQATSAFQLVVKLVEKLDDKKNLAIGLGAVASVAYLPLGALQAAEANHRRRIALCQELEDEYQEAVGGKELGHLLAYRGLWEEAEVELAAAQLINERDKHIQGQTLIWAYRSLSALLQVRTGETQAAATALAAAQRSMTLADEYARTRYPIERDYVRSHWLLGAAYRVNGNLAESDHHLSDALTRCRAINLVDMEADILLDLARLRVDQRQPEEALRLAEEAQAIAERSGYVLQGADIQLFLAEQALARGEQPQALAYARKAQALATCDGGEYTYKVTYDAAGRLLQQLEGS